MLSQEAISCTRLKSRGKRAIEAETDASPKLQLPPKKQKRSLNSTDTGSLCDWLKIADAVCGHSWTRIYQSDLPHDSPIDDLQKECIRRKCNAFIINKTKPAVQL
eukprot:1874700-Prymnesium_polylepis.1